MDVGATVSSNGPLLLNESSEKDLVEIELLGAEVGDPVTPGGNSAVVVEVTVVSMESDAVPV